MLTTNLKLRILSKIIINNNLMTEFQIGLLGAGIGMVCCGCVNIFRYMCKC